MDEASGHLPYEGGAEAASGPVRQRAGEIEVDFRTKRVTVAGAALELTGGEYALLLHFVERPNRLITRAELFAKVWNTPAHTGSNLVDVVVCRLRRRLGAQGRMIETVRGLGYRMRAP